MSIIFELKRAEASGAFREVGEEIRVPIQDVWSLACFHQNAFASA
jgi:hypothetical protein